MTTACLFALIIFLASKRTSALLVEREQALISFRERLLRAEQSARSGSVDLRSVMAACGSELASLGETARRGGLALTPTLVELRRRVGSAEALQREARRLWRLFLGRVTVALGIAALGRLYLWTVAEGEALQALRVEDATALALASVLAAGGLHLFAKRLPAPWMWQGRLAPSALPWLEALATGRGRGEAPLLETLKDLERRELVTGVSLRAERRRLLVEWGREASREDRHKLRACEDWLPLLELFGIGLPAGLVLLVPAMVFVRQLG